MSAMDVICVMDDGHYICTPFYVGFSSSFLQVPCEEKVHMIVNYRTIHEVPMTKDLSGNVLFDGLGSIEGRRVPSHRFLDAMGLKKGPNSIAFATTTSNQMVSAKIFLWDINEKIIVTDIDGTITRSDKRGHFYARMGLSWHHNSVVTCFNSIFKLGYKILYLTARSVTMDVITRKYLDDLNLPAGPLLLSSKGFMEAFTSEVITKDAKFGKFEHLSHVMSLFPKYINELPIVAGFGNNENDEWAYREAGVPPDHIFIVNKKSEILVAKSKTSYESVEKEVCKFFKSLVDDLKNSVEMLPSEENADEESLKTHTENPMKEIVKEADKAAGGRGEDEEENQNGANGRGRSVVKPSQQPVHAQALPGARLHQPSVGSSREQTGYPPFPHPSSSTDQTGYPPFPHQSHPSQQSGYSSPSPFPPPPQQPPSPPHRPPMYPVYSPQQGYPSQQQLNHRRSSEYVLPQQQLPPQRRRRSFSFGHTIQSYPGYGIYPQQQGGGGGYPPQSSSSSSGYQPQNGLPPPPQELLLDIDSLMLT